MNIKELLDPLISYLTIMKLSNNIGIKEIDNKYYLMIIKLNDNKYNYSYDTGELRVMLRDNKYMIEILESDVLRRNRMYNIFINIDENKVFHKDYLPTRDGIYRMMIHPLDLKYCFEILKEYLNLYTC